MHKQTPALPLTLADLEAGAFPQRWYEGFQGRDAMLDSSLSLFCAARERVGRVAPEGSRSWFPDRKVSGTGPPQPRREQTSKQQDDRALPRLQTGVLLAPLVNRAQREDLGTDAYAVSPPAGGLPPSYI